MSGTPPMPQAQATPSPNRLPEPGRLPRPTRPLTPTMSDDEFQRRYTEAVSKLGDRASPTRSPNRSPPKSPVRGMRIPEESIQSAVRAKVNSMLASAGGQMSRRAHAEDSARERARSPSPELGSLSSSFELGAASAVRSEPQLHIPTDKLPERAVLGQGAKLGTPKGTPKDSLAAHLAKVKDSRAPLFRLHPDIGSQADESASKGVFGSIRFADVGGAAPAKFIRLPYTHAAPTSPADVIDLMSETCAERLRLSIPRARVDCPGPPPRPRPTRSLSHPRPYTGVAASPLLTWLLSSAGGAGLPDALISIVDTTSLRAADAPRPKELPKGVRLALQRGIAEAVRRTHAWLCTGGHTDALGTRIAGLAVQYARRELNLAAPTCVGIVDIDAVRQHEAVSAPPHMPHMRALHTYTQCRHPHGAPTPPHSILSPRSCVRRASARSSSTRPARAASRRALRCWTRTTATSCWSTTTRPRSSARASSAASPRSTSLEM